MTTLMLLDGEDWVFKGFVGESWHGSVQAGRPDGPDWKQGTVPGTVYYDLWTAGEIEDPYYEQNSLFAEWVPARYWVYKKYFAVALPPSGSGVELCFEGIDYAARVYLNGAELGYHEGMYVPACYRVESLLRYGEDNVLTVVIEPAPQEQPQVGRTNLVTTHKSRMTYWWDFCPRMIHVGIWDSVYLQEVTEVCIQDIYVRTDLDATLSTADVDVTVELSAVKDAQVQMRIELRHEGETVCQHSFDHVLAAGSTTVQSRIRLEQPHLWWPNGLGVAHLYDARVQVIVDGTVVDDDSVTFGVRTVRLEVNEGAPSDARPYTFVVNGIPTYVTGWNWVPIDVMYGRRQPDKLRHLLRLAKAANVNLLRVWGGGLIEREAFYRLCDEYGMMVWQEWIQSSSGIENKPSERPEFIEMMVDQAKRIIPRRRNHASLVLWCGGNELQDLEGKPLDDSEPVLSALRDVVFELHPDANWLPTSPSGPLFMNSIENIEQNPDGLHDVHGPWEFQGVRAHYRLYNRGTSLFHSEFGVEGIANLRTIHTTIAPEHQWPATRENPVWNHRGSWWINEPMVQESFSGIRNLEDLVRASQFLQAEGLRYAIEANRRRAPRNSGTIPWQMNESYPNAYCTAAVDFYGRPKPAYYAVARAYRSIAVTARFDTMAWEGRDRFEAEVYLIDFRSLRDAYANVRTAELVAQLRDVGGHVIRTWVAATDIASERLVMHVLDLDMSVSEIPSDVFFLDLHLFDEEGTLHAENRYLFSRTNTLKPLRTVDMTTLHMCWMKNAEETLLTIRNDGSTAAIAVQLEDTLPLGADCFMYFSDSYFHLFPGETRQIEMSHTMYGRSSFQVEVGGWNTSKQVWTIKSDYDAY